MVLLSLTGGHGQSQDSLAGSWQALFRDSLSSGTITLNLESPRKGVVSGKYQTSDGKTGIVSGRQKHLRLDLTFTQQKSCPGFYSLAIQLSGSTGSGTYTGRDCLGEHSDGVISMAPAGDNYSPPPLPAPAPTITDPWMLERIDYYKRQRAKEDAEQQEREARTNLEKTLASEQETENKIKAVEAEEASIRLGYLKHQAEYLDDIGNLDPADPQYKTKLDLLQLKIKLVSEALSGLPPESPSDIPATIPTAARGKRPLSQVQVISLVAGQVPNHRIAMLVNERGIDFEPQQDYLEQVSRGGGDDELIRALRNARVYTPQTAR
jgi:hypothetical protein